MNTMPDETTLVRWLDDDLQGAELAAFEDSIKNDPALFARREAARAWRAAVANTIPAALEPPYPDFFNSRIEKAIRELSPQPRPPAKAPFWRAWWLPATAVAGIILAFWAGTLTGGRETRVVTIAKPVPVAAAPVAAAPVLYTPEHGVDAELFTSADAEATVIVLEGVEAIPDALDFSESVGWRNVKESTADTEPAGTDETEVTQ